MGITFPHAKGLRSIEARLLIVVVLLLGTLDYLALEWSGNILNAPLPEQSAKSDRIPPTAPAAPNLAFDTSAIYAAERLASSTGGVTEVARSGCSPTPADELAQPLGMFVTTSAVKVRRKPERSSSPVRTLKKGTVVSVLSRRDGWVEVALTGSNPRGWMVEMYLSEASRSGQAPARPIASELSASGLTSTSCLSEKPHDRAKQLLKARA